jgi:hypothetical protein
MNCYAMFFFEKGQVFTFGSVLIQPFADYFR